MKITKTSIAGTLESSDVQITLMPNDKDNIEIDLESEVIKQFGDQIKKVIMDTLKKYEITSAKVKVVDKGALDCTINARLVAAVQRNIDKRHDINWEVL